MKKIIILLVVLCSGIGSFAQKTDSSMHHHHHVKSDAIQDVYTCSMHPEVISSTPGKCPKCGMDLVKKNKETGSKKIYTCSMHPEIQSDKPGNCPKCGMKLVEKKITEKEKTQKKGMDGMKMDNM
ncbi:MAG: heavy metal-binding domain-containing protein [Bacteroidota bacterium]